MWRACFSFELVSTVKWALRTSTHWSGEANAEPHKTVSRMDRIAVRLGMIERNFIRIFLIEIYFVFVLFTARLVAGIADSQDQGAPAGDLQSKVNVCKSAAGKRFRGQSSRVALSGPC